MRSASLPVGPKNDTIEKTRPAASTPPAADRYSVSLSRLSRFGAECPLTYFSSLIHADPFPGIGTGSKLRMAWVGLVRAR